MLQRDNSLRSGNQSPTEGGQGLGRTQSMSAVVAQRGKGAVEVCRWLAVSVVPPP